MDQLRYIAIEGPIGVGKTSLAQMLSQDLKARLILEEIQKNPFLASFYTNPQGYAFQTQLFFLVSRYRQQSSLKQQDLFKQITVSDYMFAKDQIFAQLNLSEDELNLYDKIYQLLDASLNKPDLVIFLQASPSVLINRIKKRNTDFEKGIQAEYVERLSQAYARFFFQYNETPLLVVNTSGIDFVKNKNDYEILKKELYYMVKSRKEKHYVTIDSR